MSLLIQLQLLRYLLLLMSVQVWVRLPQQDSHILHTMEALRG